MFKEELEKGVYNMLYLHYTCIFVIVLKHVDTISVCFYVSLFYILITDTYNNVCELSRHSIKQIIKVKWMF